jgi:hypothetical protein
MAESATTANGGRSGAADTTAAATDVVTQIVRNAAAEAIKGGRSFEDVVRAVVADAVKTIEEKAPRLTEDAGILNWRYAALGWITWNIGKRVVKRKAATAFRRERGGDDG